RKPIDGSAFRSEWRRTRGRQMMRTGCVMVTLFLIVASRQSASAQGFCGNCEHLCMWTSVLMSAEASKALFSNPELVGAADNVEVLNGAVDYAGTQWSSSLSNVIQSPCYQIIVKEFYGGEPLASTTLNEVVTHLPPSGNLFHTEYDKKGKDG